MQANINVRAIAQGCTEYNITVVLSREDCVRALKAVHSRFYLSRTTIAVGIVGPGLIGATLLDQLRDQVNMYLTSHQVLFSNSLFSSWVVCVLENVLICRGLISVVGLSLVLTFDIFVYHENMLC